MNIISYVKDTLLTFEESALNEVDSLVFSQLSYIHFDGLVSSVLKNSKPIVLKDLYCNEYFNRLFTDIRDPESNREFFCALAASKRYRNVKINYYENQLDHCEEMQFSATTFIINDKICYIAFRGTDSSMTGWKEDFNMTFLDVVPAQLKGVRYLNKVASLFKGNIHVGGHSKGGNIAVYSSAMSSIGVRDRIISIYNHDGPGFLDKFLNTGEYISIEPKIRKTIPESSLFGILLEDQTKYRVVKSSRVGLMQHCPFSWIVENNSFIVVDRVKFSSEYADSTIHTWLYSVSEEKRKLFVDTLFSVLKNSGCKTINEFKRINSKQMIEIVRGYNNVDTETRRFLSKTIKQLFIISFIGTKKNSR